MYQCKLWEYKDAARMKMSAHLDTVHGNTDSLRRQDFLLKSELQHCEV